MIDILYYDLLKFKGNFRVYTSSSYYAMLRVTVKRRDFLEGYTAKKVVNLESKLDCDWASLQSW
jgi:hypothetical protein